MICSMSRTNQTSAERQYSAENYVELFTSCHEKGDIGRAFSFLSLALSLDNNLKQEYYEQYINTLESWTNQLEKRDSPKEDTLKIYEVAVDIYSDSPDIQILLARSLQRFGNIHEAWQYAYQVSIKCPQDPRVQDTQAQLANTLLDRWHYPMINDRVRNEKFKAAIEKAASSGHQSMLDIGAGTGVLSVFAHRSGINRIHTCELDPFMYEMMEAILLLNGETVGLTTHKMNSSCLTIPEDLPGRVSLVVTETVDSGLLGEGILETLLHAWQHLLLPSATEVPLHNLHLNENHSNFSNGHCNVDDILTSEIKYGHVIPSHAQVFAAIIEAPRISHQMKLTRTDLPYPFDGSRKVSVDFTEPYMSENLRLLQGGFRMLTSWVAVTIVDMNLPSSIEDHLKGGVNRVLDVIAIAAGRADAIALAFHLYLHDDISIDTFPSTETCWENAIYPIMDIVNLQIGQTCQIKMECDGLFHLSLQLPVNATVSIISEQLSTTGAIHLSPYSLRCMNSPSYTDYYSKLASHITPILLQQKKPLVICDSTPFPLVSISLARSIPNCIVCVDDMEIMEMLTTLGIQTKLCSELSDQVDIFFLWLVNVDGTITSNLMNIADMCRKNLAPAGHIFPQELELHFSAVESSSLAQMTRIDDQNTCGVVIGDIFNMAKTTHHLDVNLNSLPIQREIFPEGGSAILRFELFSGIVTKLREKENCSLATPDLLICGGKCETVRRGFDVSDRNVALNALPYWFSMRSFVPNVSSTFVNYSLLTDTPRITQETPTITQKTPTITQETPTITQETPTITQETPTITQETPTITQETPTITQETPTITQETPTITQETPTITQETPATTQDSPTTTQETPIVTMNSLSLMNEPLILSTRSIDSPCNQSVFMLESPLTCAVDDNIILQVVWREAIFHATLHQN